MLSTRTESNRSAQVTDSLARATTWLVAQQHPDGYWCGELEGDSILESEYILLLAWLGREHSDNSKRAARHLLAQQCRHGGWGLYPGSELEISASVKAYLALKLTGHDPQSQPMQEARAAIRAAGGADRVNSFTRFYLALLGQISYDHCPAVPPEMVLLPHWSPINIYRMSAWSRTILVPLAVMWAHRPVREIPAELGISELFLDPPEQWPALQCPKPTSEDATVVSRIREQGWNSFFRSIDTGLKWCERRRWTPFRARALAVARQWILEHCEESDGLGAIFPPIIWSVVALRCLGESADSPHVEECHRQLEGLMIHQDDTTRLQPCLSPVWDTALSLRALATSDRSNEQPPTAAGAMQKGSDWLLKKEVQRRGDWSIFASAEPSGWFFEHRNAFYPDTDDTAMVLMALPEVAQDEPQGGQHEAASERTRASCQRGLEWLRAMQNRDGGWGAFDRNNDREFLCHVPFADHNAMIDPSTPDITARVLEAFASHGFRRGQPFVDKAIRYLIRTQERDGSWFGRWGVNHIYGTWQVLTGLVAIGLEPGDRVIQRGAEWLIDHQSQEGGWGESAASYGDPEQRGVGPRTPSQTSWALLGLIAAGRGHDLAVQRGVEYLLANQQPNGTWREAEFTGTGFPLVFYLRYHMYPAYFPMLALAAWRDATGER